MHWLRRGWLNSWWRSFVDGATGLWAWLTHRTGHVMATCITWLTLATRWVIDHGRSLYSEGVQWFLRTSPFRWYRRIRLWGRVRYAPVRRLLTRKRGWLSGAIGQASAHARPRTSIGKTLGFELPRSRPWVVIGIIIAVAVVLAACSSGLSLAAWQFGLPTGGALDGLYTTMWQVQAGIAALALPVLLFVVERSRDDPRAAFRSPEILLRDSYAYHIMAFSFIVVAHIGVDLTWFGSSATVVLFDLILVAATLVLALYAYFKVVQLIMSSSLLRDRSVALGNERLADVAWRTGRRLTGSELLRKEFDALGVSPWLFQQEDPTTQLTVSIQTPEPKYLDDINLPSLRRFLNQLPRKPEDDATTTQGLPAASTTTESREPAIWFLLDYGSLIRPPGTPFLRFRRDAFDFLDGEAIASIVNACVHLRASDDF